MTSAPPTSPILLPLPEVSAATGVPSAAVRRYAELKILSPITTAAAAEYYYPAAILPVITTLGIMELTGCSAHQLRDTSTSLLHMMATARTGTARQRLTQHLNKLQARLVEDGPRTPELSELTGHSLPSRT